MTNVMNVSLLFAAKTQHPTKLMEGLEAKNPIFMMSDSGARGNISNFTQLAGMRGLMAAQWSNGIANHFELP